MKSLHHSIIVVLMLLLAGCTIPVRRGLLPREPRPTPIAGAPIGTWKLIATDEQGSTPAPNMLQMLTIADDGTARMDMWEHALSLIYELPDPNHIQLTWIGSTNPNDKVGEVWTYAFTVDGDELRFLSNDKLVYLFQRQSVIQATPRPTGTETVAAQLDAPFTLQPGQWAMLDATQEGFSVQFQAVTEDSRCPARVNCAWSGEARVQIGVRTDEPQNAITFELTTNPAEAGASVQYHGYTVALVDVQPYPQQDFASDEIDADEYSVTFMISKTEPEPTATVQPTTMPAPPPRAQPTPIGGAGQTLAVALQQPFQLNKGQTAVIESEDFQLTFRSVTDDSGCFAPNDCSLMTFDGTLAAQKGKETELMTVMASLHAGSWVDLEFAGYTIELRGIQQIEGKGHVATFVVLKTTAQQAQVWPAAQPTIGCARFTPFAAAAILDEEVQERAFANLRFGPLHAENEAANGLCGYASTAFTPDKAVDYTVPHLATALDADHAVVAAQIAGVDALELLALADVIQAANPDDAALDRMMITTMLMAGDTEGVMTHLYDSAQNIPALHTEFVDGIGEQALWVWQTFSSGHFATLIVLDQGEFTVVAALLGENRDEQDIQSSMSALASKIVR